MLAIACVHKHTAGSYTRITYNKLQVEGQLHTQPFIGSPTTSVLPSHINIIWSVIGCL